MGCAPSTDADKIAREQHARIEKIIDADKRAVYIKMLLLGAGECGKSTVLKQMKILHKGGFTPEEMESIRVLIYANIFESLSALCHAAYEQKIEFDNTFNSETALLILRTVEEHRQMRCPTKEMTQRLKLLWKDSGLQMTYKLHRSAYHVIDSVAVYCKDLDRICDPSFSPTQVDALHARVATNGIIQVEFKVKNTDFRVFDVGGQRSERRKWIHCFDDVKAIIYVSAISEYDQKLREDNESNRLKESMELFRQVCHSNWFSSNVSMILFLNKIDLFMEKLEKVKLTVLFKDYKGDNSFDSALAHIRAEFEARNDNPDERKIYPHATCATDTNQVELVLDGVFDTIIQHNLNRTGLG